MLGRSGAAAALPDGLQSANFALGGLTTDDPREIAWRATIIGFDGGCTYRGGGVRLRYTIDLSGVAGPAFDGRPLIFPYFIAVEDPAGTLLAKQSLQAELPRPAGREAVGSRETIDQTIAGVTPADARAWRIYIGIDLPPEAVRTPDR